MASQAERREATTGAILGAARKLFGTKGFADTSIDDVAAKAGVAKGAVYHHFASKEELFTRVLEGVQQELAERQMGGTHSEAKTADRVAAGVRRYLLNVCEPDIRQILLIDGPAVIGWLKWREIDMHYFGAITKAAVETMLPDAPARQIESVSQLLLGAVMEASLVCSTAVDPRKKAHELTQEFRTLLSGWVKA